jgi:hypothetical protein
MGAGVARDVTDLVADIKLSYDVIGGRDAFLADPGGWIAYLGLTDDDELAREAIDAIRGEREDERA